MPDLKSATRYQFPQIMMTRPVHFLAVLILVGAPVRGLGADNLIPNGDFEDGPIDAVISTLPEENTTSFEGSPVAGETSKGICAEVTLPGESSLVYFKPKLFVDSQLKYRMSVRIFTTAAVDLQIGGYGMAENNAPLPVEGGHWGFNLKTEDGQLGKGPFQGWVKLTTTFGPEGSGADNILVPEVLFLNLVFRIKGGEGEKFYIDDLVFQEVENFK